MALLELRCPGVETLRLIGYQAVRNILHSLVPSSRRPFQLDRDYEVASSTFHRHAPELLRVKAITRRTVPGPPRQVFYELGPSGKELCQIADGWLGLLQPSLQEFGRRKRDGRVPMGFAEAWGAGLIQALLDGPLDLAEIELAVRPSRPGLTPHQVKRLLINNCAARFLMVEDNEGTERYQLVEHGRYAIAELVASARFERLYMPAKAIPITVNDVAKALRAHLPLLCLPEGMGGVCEFCIAVDRRQGASVALTWADLQDGHVVASGIGLPPRPGTCWVRGTVEEWMSAVIDHDLKAIRSGGDRRLGRAVVDSLHSRLYPRYGWRPSTIRPMALPS